MTTCDLNISFKLPNDAVGVVSNLYEEFYTQVKSCLFASRYSSVDV